MVSTRVSSQFELSCIVERGKVKKFHLFAKGMKRDLSAVVGFRFQLREKDKLFRAM